MTDLEIDEHLERDEWDKEQFVDMSLTTKLYHDKGNAESETNRHAIVIGEDVIIVKKAE